MATVYVDADTRKAIANLAKLDKEFDKFGKNVEKDLKKVSSGMTLLKTAGAGLAGVFAVSAIANFTGQMIALGDQYSNINSKLKLTTDSAAEFESVYKSLYDLGKETGSQMSSNAQSFSKLANALPEAEANDLVGYLDTVNKSLITSGTEAQEASAFMIQWSQAMGSGVVAGDELKSMVESNSYLMGKMAKSIIGPGGTVAALKKMGSEGQLTSELFSEHLGKIAKDVDKDFAAMEKTVSRAWNEVTETMKSIFADANEGANGTKDLAESISNIATVIEDNRDGILSLFTAMIDGVSGALEIMGNLGQSLAGLAAYKGGDITFWEYATADAEELTILLNKVKQDQQDIAGQEQKLQALLSKRSGLESEQGGTLGGIGIDSSTVSKELSEIDSQIKKLKENISSEKAKIEIDSSDAKKSLEEVASVAKDTSEKSVEEWEKYVTEVKKLNQEIVADYKSLSEDIRDIQREGMTDEGAWDDILKQISEYKKLASDAGAANQFREQKEYLSQIASLYKSLPKDGISGAAPTSKQLTSAKQMVTYWKKIYDQQTTFAAKGAYAKKIDEAKAKLIQLQKEEESGGRAIISADESRKVRLEGLKSVQSEMLVINEQLKESTKEHGAALLEITDAFSGEKLAPAKKAMEDITSATDDVTEAYVLVGDTWTNVTDDILNDLERQIRMMAQAEAAAESYREELDKISSSGGTSTSSSGSSLPGFAVGGLVPGFGGTDSVLARLTPGEGVLTPLGLSALGGSSALSQLNVGQNPFSDQSGDIIDMSFNFNNKSIGTLRGERAAANKILDQFSNMRRSLS